MARTAPAKEIPTVDQKTLETLREAKEDATEAAAVAREKDAYYQRLVVQAIRSTKCPVEGSILCLDCGEIRKVQEHQCSKAIQ